MPRMPRGPGAARALAAVPFKLAKLESPLPNPPGPMGSGPGHCLSGQPQAARPTDQSSVLRESAESYASPRRSGWAAAAAAGVTVADSEAVTAPGPGPDIRIECSAAIPCGV